jgi:hypothetical protein
VVFCGSIRVTPQDVLRRFIAGPTALIGQVYSSQVEEAGVMTILAQDIIATISVAAVFGQAISALTL